MKIRLTILLCIMIFSVSVCGCSTNQIKSSTADYNYEIENNAIKILSHQYNPEETRIVIPEEINGKPVEVLESDSFYQHINTTSIIMPKNLKAIEGSPFYRCYSLKESFLPAGVKKIDSNPFFRCSSLARITVDSNNEYYSDENGVLFDKDKTQLIAYPEGKTSESYVVPNTVKKLNADSFGYHAQLKRLTILSNVIDFPDDNMFIFPNDITLIVEADSAAEQYAKDHNLKYEMIDR